MNSYRNKHCHKQQGVDFPKYALNIPSLSGDNMHIVKTIGKSARAENQGTFNELTRVSLREFYGCQAKRIIMRMHFANKQGVCVE